MDADVDRNWGSKPSAFYGQSDDEGSSDEELQQNEAKLLQKLQKERLDTNDFTLFGDDSDEEDGEDAKEKEATVKRGKKKNASAKTSTDDSKLEEVEIERDVSAFTTEEQLAFLRKEHPELLPLLADLETEAATLRQLNPLEPRLHLLTEEGKRWVQLQLNLRREYIMHICFYLRLLAKGRFSRDHPIVSQILNTRTTLRKYAELDTATKTDIEEVSRIAASSNQFDKVDEEESVDNSEDDEGEIMRFDRLRPHMRLLSERVHLIQAAREDRMSVAAPSAPRTTTLRDMFRLPSKAKKRESHIEDPNLLPFMPNKRQASEMMNDAQRLQEYKMRAPQSGDVQVDFRVRKKARFEEPEEASLPEPMKPTEEALKMSKKQRKAQKKLAKQLENLPKPEKEVQGKRQASKHILQNRGLVRQRKKTSGNARVSNRHKYEKAVKRRRGAVVDMREGAADGATYAGEETGVRTNLKKSKNLS
eukprot:GEMP01029785.1.p1 GENE.GEMP01029785.1~~GEMP01029785.1.p1  ORF type:complete len:476 (+),score=142.20 GEMP01029785.1:111-1538(+)